MQIIERQRAQRFSGSPLAVLLSVGALTASMAAIAMNWSGASTAAGQAEVGSPKTDVLARALVASHLAIQDEKGRVVASIHPADGGATLTLTSYTPGSEAPASIHLVAKPDATYISVGDGNRVIGIGPGYVSIVARNPSQQSGGNDWMLNKPAVYLGARAETGGFVDVSNTSGKAVVSLQSSKANRGLISVDSGDGNTAVQIAPDARGGGFVDVYNAHGKLVVSVQSNKMNEGMVIIKDANGNASNSLSTRP